MIAHAQKEFRAAKREEEAKQVDSWPQEDLIREVESRISKRNVGSDERLQEERLRLAEKGNLGWVQREVQPRQWADQVHHLSGI